MVRQRELRYDPRDLLDEFRIEYVEKGANVAKGNVNVACPMCGDDPSHHLGIQLSTGYWGCWRNKAHRGRTFAYLLARLAGLSMGRARELCGTDSVKPEGMLAAVLAMNAEEDSERTPTASSVELPRDCYPINRDRKVAMRFYDYLWKRGFQEPFEVAQYYDLHYAINGEMEWRTVFPVKQYGQLVTYLGRHIRAGRLRYKAQETEAAVEQVKDCVFNMDRVRTNPGETLAIVEGPLDAMKVDWYGWTYGLRAVALFGLSVSDVQATKLLDVCEEYRSVVVLLDSGYTAAAMRMQDDLAFLGRRLTTFQLDKLGGRVFSDPGEMTCSAVRKLARKLC